MIKIAIASGKGGTGKTFVATNFFYSLIRNKIDALLVDCDAEAPNAVAFFEAIPVNSFEVTHLVPVINTDDCIYCAKCHEYCNYNAIVILPPVKFIQVIEELCHGCGACVVACQSGAITEKPVSLGKVTTFSLNGQQNLIEARMNVGVMSPVPLIKSAIKQADNGAGVIIFDSPPGSSCPFIQTVIKSDYVILVTEPTPFGLSDLKNSVETLKELNRPYGVIVNCADVGDNAVYDWLKENNILLLMEIPFDREIARIYSEGRLITEEKDIYRTQFIGLLGTIENLINNIQK